MERRLEHYYLGAERFGQTQRDAQWRCRCIREASSARKSLRANAFGNHVPSWSRGNPILGHPPNPAWRDTSSSAPSREQQKFLAGSHRPVEAGEATGTPMATSAARTPPGIGRKASNGVGRAEDVRVRPSTTNSVVASSTRSVRGAPKLPTAGVLRDPVCARNPGVHFLQSVPRPSTDVLCLSTPNSGGALMDALSEEKRRRQEAEREIQQLRMLLGPESE